MADFLTSPWFWIFLAAVLLFPLFIKGVKLAFKVICFVLLIFIIAIVAFNIFGMS